MSTLYFEDMPLGASFTAKGVPITADEIIAFAKQFDPQPFHLDDAAARRTPFGGLCASGWHTAALTMRIACDSFILRTAGLGSPGIDELRWLKPVFVGDTLNLEATVIETRPSKSRPTQGSVRSLWVVKNQRGEPVMELKAWTMISKRNP